MESQEERVYTIPASTCFVDALATGLLKETYENPEKLTRYRILLPTRRACRSLRESFLSLSNGKPMLLPQMHPIGDVDEDELLLSFMNADAISIPPSMPTLQRQFLLSRTILKIPGYEGRPDQAVALAGSLGQLMDKIYTEGLDLKNLPDLVDREELAHHWQITVRFLEILSEIWPAILESHGMIDAADRRIRLMNKLCDLWSQSPPTDPVIAAGSTGSIPATAELLKLITTLPKGRVILPALDTSMDLQSWDALDDTHPQATLKQLIKRLDIELHNVAPWPYEPDEPVHKDHAGHNHRQTRFTLAREVMRPAQTADQWQNFNLTDREKHDFQTSLDHVMRFDCETQNEEALLIAALFRQTLQTPYKTAALITPDRTLARRVAAACARWGIIVNDSGGQTLQDTDIGRFTLLCIDACSKGLAPVALLALLKHKLSGFCDDTKSMHAIQLLEKYLLRGPAPMSGFDGLYKRLSDSEKITEDARHIISDLLNQIEPILRPLVNHSDSRETPFKELLDEHIRALEALFKVIQKDGSLTLWDGEEGDAAALFFSDLRQHAALLPNTKNQDYGIILNHLMRNISIRPRYGAHPRLTILGQLEARLIRADVMILAGLNEGQWPPETASDPWMSRPMRQKFGLPSPERSIGLSAHDFTQCFCAQEVVLTRALRQNGSPTVAARWLKRLETVLNKIDPALHVQMISQPWLEIIRRFDSANAIVPIERPAPRPPVKNRPRKLPVTAIETWMRDPYALYAKYILKLRKLDPLEDRPDAAQRGTMLHNVLDRFIQSFPDNIPDHAQQTLLEMGKNDLSEQLENPALWTFWWPRFVRLSDWFVQHEILWREHARPVKTEHEGSIIFEDHNDAFTLTAKADRIDRKNDRTYAIIDYKTGTPPSSAAVCSGLAPQLSLEALILERNGFPGIQGDVGYLGFWRMTGGEEQGSEHILSPGRGKSYADLIQEAEKGLEHLITTFDDPSTPYISLPDPSRAPRTEFQDYAHLARVQEWSTQDTMDTSGS